MSTETESKDIENTSESLIERLFKVGAHFGFPKSRRHPSVRPYLYGNKQGTDIFDLEKTADSLTEARTFIETFGQTGQTILYVSTKAETAEITRAEAERAGVPYVVNRWIGGMLTNFSEIKKRLDRRATLISEGETGELERKYTKKELLLLNREIEKLNFNFGGISTLEKTPTLLVVVDPRHNHIAVAEACTMGIPVIGIMSSDNDISRVKYPIIMNDTLQGSVRMVLQELTDAYLDGRVANASAQSDGNETTPITPTATQIDGV